MKVLICGSRGWHNAFPINALLAGLDVLSEGADEKLTVILCDAPALTRKLAIRWGAEVVEAAPANGAEYNAEAGSIRNQKMLDDHQPEVVYAFLSDGKSNGAEDMIEKSTAAGIPTFVVTEE